MPDPIESMAFIAIAIATASQLTIQNCPIDFLRIELEKLLYRLNAQLKQAEGAEQ